jgi:hypothetical protein
MQDMDSGVRRYPKPRGIIGSALGRYHWSRFVGPFVGLAALSWFLLRVIAKPSRASYPCQRAAFPVASAFILWILGAAAWVTGVRFVGARLNRHKPLAVGVMLVAILGVMVWTLQMFPTDGQAALLDPSRFNWKPDAINKPIGIARGINPGRVVLARDPLATKWAGNWKQTSDQWWTDANNDQDRIDAMMSLTLRKLTSTVTDEEAWKAIFKFYKKSRGLPEEAYKAGEVVAVKINLNNTTGPTKNNNYIDASPHMVLAMVRQLVKQAHVAERDIIVYDAKRYITPAILTKVWGEFKGACLASPRTSTPAAA